jgi:hypothetical protein
MLLPPPPQSRLNAHAFFGGWRGVHPACDPPSEIQRSSNKYMTALPTRETVPATPAPIPQPTTTERRKRPRSNKPKGNQPAFDLAAQLERILGVSAQRIDGIDVMTIQTVVAEVGTDLRA